MRLIQLNTPSTYSGSARFFHWATVLLLAAQYVIAWTMPDVHHDTQPIELIAWHLSVGMLILLLVAVRVVWRITHPAPCAARVARHSTPPCGCCTPYTLAALSPADRVAVDGMGQCVVQRLANFHGRNGALAFAITPRIAFRTLPWRLASILRMGAARAHWIARDCSAVPSFRSPRCNTSTHASRYSDNA
jgi:hypothetical protein